MFEILRFAQNDRKRDTQNDRKRDTQNDREGLARQSATSDVQLDYQIQRGAYFYGRQFNGT